MVGLIHRMVVRVSAALALLAAVGGIPAALIIFVGWPLPTSWPNRETFTSWVTTPVTDTVVINLLAIAAWLLWAAFVHAILGEARAAWRGLPTRATTGRTGNPLRLAAAGLITALVLGSGFTGAATADATPAQAQPAASQVVKNFPVVPIQRTPPTLVLQGPATIQVGEATYTYVVERADTLSKISQAWLGDSNRWPEICQLNQHRHFPKVGGTLRDCDLIFPGWDLRLPAGARPPAGTVGEPSPSRAESPASSGAAAQSTPARPVNTPPGPGASGALAPSAAAPSATEATSVPEVSPSPGTASTPTPTPTPTASGPNQPAASPSRSSSAADATATPSTPGEASAAAPSADEQGVRLPGGSFVPWTLAAAIAAAVAMVWLHRRRRFVPGEPGQGNEPPELPPPVIELHRQVNRKPDLPTPSDLAERAAAVPVLPLLPAGGVGVVGDGAHAAARAAVVSILASGGPADPDRRGEVVIDGTTLSTLIGADAATLGPWPRLHVADDIDHALTILDARLLHRARVLDEHSLTDLDSLRERAPDEEALPPVLLVCETPPPGARMRARVSLGLGNGLEVSALLLGAWPSGSTFDVATDGHTRLVDGAPVDGIAGRVAVLDTAEAVAILATLREAHTGEPPNQALRPAAPHRTAVAVDSTAGLDGANEPEPDQANETSANASGRLRQKVKLRVLGNPDVEDVTLPGRSLRGKAAELAVFLACHPDGADTETIAEYLMPEARRRPARQQVHTNASNLRHVFSRAGGALPGGYLLKRGTTSRYRLDPATVEVDLWRLRDLLTRAQLASVPTRVELLHEACDLYAAPLADKCDYEWVEPHREKARRWGTEAHLLLADDLLSTDPQAASDLLDKAIGLDRYNEELYRKAMRARHALADADGIRALLRVLTKTLADLDVEPDEATLDLAQQLRASLEQR